MFPGPGGSVFPGSGYGSYGKGSAGENAFGGAFGTYAGGIFPAGGSYSPYAQYDTGMGGMGGSDVYGLNMGSIKGVDGVVDSSSIPL